MKTCSIFFSLALATAFAGEIPDGNSTIRGKAGPSEIVITTTSRVAGAIHSLTWNGQEFLDSYDHGRQLQSASNLDFGTPILAETFNPTEAGSAHDGAETKSSSQLLHLTIGPNELQTESKMAFWLAPGEKSGPNPAKNTTVLSEHLLRKRVHIGYHGLDNVISYDVTFTLPPGERQTLAVFEALTGYMPAAFERFQQYNPATGELEALSDGPGEIGRPVVLSRPDGGAAMGIYSPPQAAKNTRGPSFGRFRFEKAKVVKWNCVFRVNDDAGLKAGDNSFRMFVVVGDVTMVRDSLRALHREFAAHSPAP